MILAAEFDPENDQMTPEAAISFLEKAARYFEKRATSGEDRAHWSNISNAENCRKIAVIIRESEAKIAHLNRECQTWENRSNRFEAEVARLKNKMAKRISAWEFDNRRRILAENEVARLRESLQKILDFFQDPNHIDPYQAIAAFAKQCARAALSRDERTPS